MEVHHHPKHNHQPKKWKSYFLEFLMIFLAVTMGFIAENIREHFVLKKHEKESMVSLVRDLNNDITGITESIDLVHGYVRRADSILYLFKNADYKNTSADIYYYGRIIGLRNLWRSNDGTLQQLSNAGGLMLVENKSVVDSIQSYINRIKGFTQLMSLEDDQVAEYRKAMGNVFSGYALDDMTNSQGGSTIVRLNYNPEFNSTAKNDLNDLILRIAIVKSNRIAQLKRMEELKTQAASLIKLINEEYNLD